MSNYNENNIVTHEHPVQTNEISHGGISGDIKVNSLELSL